MKDKQWGMPPDRSKAMMLAIRQLPELVYDAVNLEGIHFTLPVNKRMGRFMMNGILLQAGYPAINLPARRQLEFNTLMLAFYDTGDEKEMNRFMRSCLDPRIIAIMKEPSLS